LKVSDLTGILTLTISVLCSGVAASVDDPDLERATFQIADGFEVNLFASERDGVVKPIQMRFDPRGRLWVIGSTVYPQLEPGQKPVVQGRTWYVSGIKLHIVSVVTCQVHRMDPNLKFGLLEGLTATGDYIF